MPIGPGRRASSPPATSLEMTRPSGISHDSSLRASTANPVRRNAAVASLCDAPSDLGHGGDCGAPADAQDDDRDPRARHASRAPVTARSRAPRRPSPSRRGRRRRMEPSRHRRAPPRPARGAPAARSSRSPLAPRRRGRHSRSWRRRTPALRRPRCRRRRAPSGGSTPLAGRVTPRRLEHLRRERLGEDRRRTARPTRRCPSTASRIAGGATPSSSSTSTAVGRSAGSDESSVSTSCAASGGASGRARAQRRSRLVRPAQPDGEPVVTLERGPPRRAARRAGSRARTCPSPSRCRAPRACSGDQYSGVPSNMPWVVTLVDERAIRARPKSETTTRPVALSISTLPGREIAVDDPARVCIGEGGRDRTARSRTASVQRKLLFRATSARFAPSTSSITRNGVSPSSP